MKQDDLTVIKYIGLNRMRLLNDCGITTIKQLRETPLTELAEIKSIGEHYAVLIKNAVSEHDMEKQEKLPEMTAAAKKRKKQEVGRSLKKRIKKLSKNLKRVDQDLKPIGQTQYLESYLDFSKKYKKLRARLGVLGRIKNDLSKKDKKLIVKAANSLSISLKAVGKNPVQKDCRRVTRKIQSFSRLLREIIA